MEMKLDEIRPDMEKVMAYVKQAGELFTDRAMAGKIRQKGSTDFVTMVDTQVQEYLLGKLWQHWPHIQSMGEEKDNSEIDFDGSVWILDPVDGTTNLIHDFMHSTMSLALAERGAVVQAVIYQPFTGEMFSAEAGRGAFLNGEPIRVSGTPSLASGLISVGTAPRMRESTDRTFRVMQSIFERCHDIRHLGSASLELCYVACGRLDGFFEDGLSPWDYAAGMLIVAEAGGAAVQPDGEPLSLEHSCSVAAANPMVLEELKRLL